MKTMTRLFIVMFLMGTLYTVNAQTEFGIKAMANYSSVFGNAEEFNDEPIESIDFGFGFAAGLFLRAGEGFVSFQGELLYGYRTSAKEVDITLPVVGEVITTVNNKYSFINVPLLAVFNLGNIKPYVGVSPGYLLSANGVSSNNITPEQETETNYLGDNGIGGVDYSEDPYFNRFVLAGNVGVMVQLSEMLHADLRVGIDLLDFTNNKYDHSILNPTEKRSDTDRGAAISLGLGYSF